MGNSRCFTLRVQTWHSAVEATQDVISAWGEGTTSERAMRSWFEKIRAGGFSLEDREGRGKLSVLRSATLLAGARPAYEALSLPAEHLAVRQEGRKPMGKGALVSIARSLSKRRWQKLPFIGRIVVASCFKLKFSGRCSSLDLISACC